MSQDKLKLLIDRLYTKTERGEINWKRGATESAVQMSVPGSSVVLDRAVDFHDIIVLRILNNYGDTTEKIDSIASDEYREKLMRLYEIAKYQALGGERALDQLLEALA